MRHLIGLCALVLVLYAGAAGGERPRTFAPVAPGEELRYKVKWNFFRLGTITVRVTRDSTCRGSGDFITELLVESNPDIGVISIRDENASWVSGSTLRCSRYFGRRWNGDEYDEMRYEFDSSAGRVVCSSRTKDKSAAGHVDTVATPDGFVEGPSLLMVARCFSGEPGRHDVPTLISGALGTTELVVDPGTEDLDLDIFDSPVRTRRYTGTTHWAKSATAGLNGDFTGWVTDDSAAVIVRAEMKVIVGSIRVELEQWTRPGWTPPVAHELLTKR